MAKNQTAKFEKKKPDVAGVLAAIRSKKSREQLKLERLRPFVQAIDEALMLGWKWSPILALIREGGGPSLTRGEAERLCRTLKEQVAGSESGLGHDEPADEFAQVSQQDRKDEVTA